MTDSWISTAARPVLERKVSMHFLAFAVISVPGVQENKETDRQIAEILEELKLQNRIEKGNIKLDIAIEKLHSLRSSFSRAVVRSVSDIMEPYCESVDDLEYLEFDDQTAKLREEYESTVDCIKLPQGTIVEKDGNPLWGRFTIRNGKVFQKDAGLLHHEKRTKKAKRMAALPAYPRKTLYKSFEEYVEERYGLSFNEECQGYGYYYNPNAMWDWYSIGGRWPEVFLVRDSCTEYSSGERSWCNADKQLVAPNGYFWVCAARKKDIAWDEIRNWRNQKVKEQFAKLERMFLEGKIAPSFNGEIVPDGILFWGRYVYRKGTTLEKYLEEYGIPKEWKYPVAPHDIVDANQWLSKEDHVLDSVSGKYVPVDWNSCTEGYLDEVDDDTVLVAVDYHI